MVVNPLRTAGRRDSTPSNKVRSMNHENIYVRRPGIAGVSASDRL